MPPLYLVALAIASFGIGSTEFIIVGLLPDVATSLSVSIPAAGFLVTGYALAVAGGAPVLAMLTARIPRRSALLLLMSFFIVGNMLCALSPTYDWLMAARVVTALAHGAFFGIGAVVASQFAAPGRRAQAIALMFSGLTLANVLGVPLGTLLGQAAGWRAAFWAVSVIGVAASAALVAWVPQVPADRTVRLLREFATLRRPQVLMAMGLSMLASVSLFTVFTYVTPMLEDVSGVPAGRIGLLLLMVGAGLTAGNLLGGRLADWRLTPAVMILFALLAVVFAALYGVLPQTIPAAAVLVVWGGVTFALVSPLQMRVVDTATDAPNLASTLNQSAFNLGNAAGAWLGGIAIESGLGYRSLPLISAGVAITALALAWFSSAIDTKKAEAVKPLHKANS